MILEPDYYVPPGTTILPLTHLVIVPFVEGMLRDETLAALHDSGEAYLTQPLDPADPYHYAACFRDWWNLPMDLIIMEQDMVPTPEQFQRLVGHDAPWVTMPYHVGEGRYTTGLGFCKIAHRLRTSYPMAGVNISTDPRGNGDLVSWASLNEAVERHLTRLGVTPYVLSGTVAHLHYPETADAAG